MIPKDTNFFAAQITRARDYASLANHQGGKNMTEAKDTKTERFNEFEDPSIIEYVDAAVNKIADQVEKVNDGAIISANDFVMRVTTELNPAPDTKWFDLKNAIRKSIDENPRTVFQSITSGTFVQVINNRKDTNLIKLGINNL